MCRASNYLKEIDQIYRKLQSDISKLQKKESEYDKAVSTIYHKIETARFNACEGYYLAKELQETLRKRRLIKHEGSRLRLMASSLSINKFSGVKEKVEKAKQENQNYTGNFGMRFSDIETEIFH